MINAVTIRNGAQKRNTSRTISRNKSGSTDGNPNDSCENQTRPTTNTHSKNIPSMETTYHEATRAKFHTMNQNGRKKHNPYTIPQNQKPNGAHASSNKTNTHIKKIQIYRDTERWSRKVLGGELQQRSLIQRIHKIRFSKKS